MQILMEMSNAKLHPMPSYYIPLITTLTLSIMICGLLSYAQQKAYSDSFIENLANSFFNQNNSTSASHNSTDKIDLSKAVSNNVTNSPNPSPPANSQLLSMKQICLNSSIIVDQFAKQQCDATMSNKFLR